MSVQKTENNKTNTTGAQDARYDTFGLISWWKQNVVRNARVMVIGAGALGNEVLKNLALMGVGEIFIVDFDTIEDSNLSRSILYRATDNGEKKAEIAAAAIQEINPDVAVQWQHLDINHQLGLGVYRRMDVVIGCLDNREARLSINTACWKLNKPWVDGAIQELLGVARVFKPLDGACYECTLTDEDYKIISQRMSCQYLAHKNMKEGKIPTTPTISSIVAGIQSQEALKLMHDMEVQSGKAFVVNGLNNDMFIMEYQKKEDCPSHVIWEDIVELPECTNSRSKLKEILVEAIEKLGAGVRLTIPALVREVWCKACEYRLMINQPRYLLTSGDILCPHCGQAMSLMTYDYIDAKTPEAILNMSLEQVGFPRLAVIEAQNLEWESAYFEITGDAKEYFNFTKSSSQTIQGFYRRRNDGTITD